MVALPLQLADLLTILDLLLRQRNSLILRLQHVLNRAQLQEVDEWPQKDGKCNRLFTLGNACSAAFPEEDASSYYT
jgi:hypothetical protein